MKRKNFSTQFKWVHIIFVEESYHLPNVTAYVYLGEAKGNLEIQISYIIGYYKGDRDIKLRKKTSTPL